MNATHVGNSRREDLLDKKFDGFKFPQYDKIFNNINENVNELTLSIRQAFRLQPLNLRKQAAPETTPAAKPGTSAIVEKPTSRKRKS